MAILNSAGNLVQSYDYTPFGRTTATGTDVGNVLGFTGREYDPASGLYYYRNRWYSPDLGRFLEPDPIGLAGWDVNLYRYVGNDPLNWWDPFGLEGGDSLDPVDDFRDARHKDAEYAKDASWTFLKLFPKMIKDMITIPAKLETPLVFVKDPLKDKGKEWIWDWLKKEYDWAKKLDDWLKGRDDRLKHKLLDPRRRAQHRRSGYWLLSARRLTELLVS